MGVAVRAGAKPSLRETPHPSHSASTQTTGRLNLGDPALALACSSLTVSVVFGSICAGAHPHWRRWLELGGLVQDGVQLSMSWARGVPPPARGGRGGGGRYGAVGEGGEGGKGGRGGKERKERKGKRDGKKKGTREEEAAASGGREGGGSPSRAPSSPRSAGSSSGAEAQAPGSATERQAASGTAAGDGGRQRRAHYLPIWVCAQGSGCCLLAGRWVHVPS